MQILENNSGSSHFYTNIELGPKEDAATITDRLIAEFEKDGIFPIIKKNTIAFTSDSANVVAGNRDGVGKEGAFTNQRLSNIWLLNYSDKYLLMEIRSFQK